MRNLINIMEGVFDDVIYHGSTTELERPYRPLTHFGTRKAALTRGAYMANSAGLKEIWMHPVAILMNNPLRIPEIDQHSVIKIVDLLFYDIPKKNRITSEERTTVFSALQGGENAGALKLAGILKSRGYDGLIYQNGHEDAGNDSVIILSDEQVQMAARPYPVPLDEAIYSLKNDY